jgi:hypothetical protein
MGMQRETRLRLPKCLGVCIMIVFDLCSAIPSHSAAVLHYRALELRGGGGDGPRGRRLQDDLIPSQSNNQTSKAGDTIHPGDAATCVKGDPSSNIANVTRACSLRRDAPKISCSVLPGAERRAHMANLAGPPGRTPLKKHVNNFLWRISD